MQTISLSFRRSKPQSYWNQWGAFLWCSLLMRSRTLRKLRSSLIMGAVLIMPSPLHTDRDNVGLFATVCEVSLKPWQSSGFSLIARAELSGSA